MNDHNIILNDIDKKYIKENKIIIKPYHQDDLGKHDHNFFELVYVTGGSALHSLNINQKTLKKGDFFFIDYGSFHSYNKCKNLTLINCLFLPEIIGETLKDCHSFDKLLQNCFLRYYNLHIKKTPANAIFHDEENRIFSLLKDMINEYNQKQIGYLEILKNKLMEIIVITTRKALDNIEFINNKTVIMDAIEYINKNYKSHSILKDFCIKNHYSTQYISRKFKQSTGITISKYCQKVRVQKSCELLTGTNLKIYEISEKVGYDDIKSFNYLFKKILNITPREYRKSD